MCSAAYIVPGVGDVHRQDIICTNVKSIITIARDCLLSSITQVDCGIAIGMISDFEIALSGFGGGFAGKDKKTDK
jgi:hypothetical protein